LSVTEDRLTAEAAEAEDAPVLAGADDELELLDEEQAAAASPVRATTEAA
jgi:hypothetical protein